MTLHRQSSPIILHGLGPNSRPVRPPRNPARLVTHGGEEPTLPPSAVLRPTTALWNDRREGRMGDRDRPPVNVLPFESLDNRKRPARTIPPPQITTPDPKIPQEPNSSMFGRSAQFTLKNKVKHHPFPPEKVPYPRSYDHKCIDTDVWETVFCEQFCGNVTFHTFDVPPTRVLDLGCGSGAWIMACAGRWKNCHFVGLDVVPLHPDLGRSELSQRVNWVQANFLEPLPFPNEEFDFVHVKRIARGVPEDKWDALFEEIVRVMKPGAVLEMLEEDLYIPGQMMGIADNDSLPSTISSSGSSDELGQLYSPCSQGPCSSLPDTAAEQSSPTSPVIRRSISNRSSGRRSTGSSGRRSNRSTPPSPQNTRPFPLLKPSNPKVRPLASRFDLHNLLSKRSGRADGAGKGGGHPKNKKDPHVPAPPAEGPNPLSVAGSSAPPDQDNSSGKIHRPPSSDGRLPSPTSYPTATGAPTDPLFEPRASADILGSFPMPPQTLDELDEPPLTLPLVEDTDGMLEVDFPQYRQDEDPRQSRAWSFSCPTPEEDDGYWMHIAIPEFDLNTVGMHDHTQQVYSSTIRDSPTLPEMELIESDQQDQEITEVSPAPPLRGIPSRRRSRAIRPSPSSNDLSISTVGLSRSMPESIVERRHRDGDQLLSPTRPPKPVRSSSTPSLAINTINTSRPTERAPPLPQNDHSSDGSGADNFIHSPVVEMPPNPRQHKLLEAIYTEMHAARFVNLAPLSLLENHIRTHFRDVSTHAPLTFTFPPPSGCNHRPEFDATELQRRNLNQVQRTEDSDHQDQYLGPDTRSSAQPSSFSQLNSPKSIPPRPIWERSPNVTNNDPGPSRARSSSVRTSRPSTANPEIAGYRQHRSGGSKPPVGHGNRTVPDRAVVTGDEQLLTRTRDVFMDASMAGGFPPAMVARAVQESAPSASGGRKLSRQRSNSLFTRSNDMKENDEGGGARRMLHALNTDFAPPSTANSCTPSSLFEYGTPNTTSSTSISSFATSSSSSTIVQHDSGKGKRRLIPAERAQSSTLPIQKTEIDVRSLGLHLRARMVEIIGCSEAMWDWLKEFQAREEKERKRKEQLALAAAKKNARRVGGGRVSYHHGPARNETQRERKDSVESDRPKLGHKRSTKSLTSIVSRKRRNGSAKWSDPSGRMEKCIKQELLHMNRERFNQMLSWFQFDMDDSILLTRSMATRIPSSVFATDLTEQRRSFDVACQKLETHLQQHPRSPSSPTKSISVTSGSSRSSHRHEEELCCLPPLLGLVHPSKRLCRTIRVWVACKP